MRMAHPRFARRAGSDTYVDVGEVPRGLACGCVCALCGGELIARQGDVLVWHFAHAPDAPCTRSPDRAAIGALVAMIGQVLAEPTALALPAYTVRVDSTPGARTSIELHVAAERRVTFDAVEGANDVPLLCRLGAHKLELVFETRETRASPGADGRGRIALELDAIAEALDDPDGPPGMTQRLRCWLDGPPVGRRWLYHPREARLREEHAARAVPAVGAATPTTTPFRYLCEPCNRSFVAAAGIKPACPRCAEPFWIRSLGPT